MSSCAERVEALAVDGKPVRNVGRRASFIGAKTAADQACTVVSARWMPTRSCLSISSRCVYPIFSVAYYLLILGTQEWTGTFFQKARLSALGLRVQLGHDVGATCPHPHLGAKDFIVIHLNGIHQVSVNFCGCYPHPEHWRQLVRFGWYPATPLNPQTCASLETLRLFQTMNLQGKISAYDFYQALVRLTDGYGIEPLPVRPILGLSCGATLSWSAGSLPLLLNHGPGIPQPPAP